jgi:hypothetical protein
MNALASFSPLSAMRRRSFHLRLPMFLLWLLLLPCFPLFLLALLIVCALYGVNPFSAIAALFRVVASLRGIGVEVQSGQLSIAFSLF